MTLPPAAGIAYNLEAHGNLAFAGLGITMFGALAPAHFGYNAIALTLNAGLFGH